MQFWPKEAGIYTSQSSKVQMPGALPGGMLTFRIDRRITQFSVSAHSYDDNEGRNAYTRSKVIP